MRAVLTAVLMLSCIAGASAQERPQRVGGWYITRAVDRLTDAREVYANLPSKNVREPGAIMGLLGMHCVVGKSGSMRLSLAVGQEILANSLRVGQVSLRIDLRPPMTQEWFMLKQSAVLADQAEIGRLVAMLDSGQELYIRMIQDTSSSVESEFRLDNVRVVASMLMKECGLTN